MAGKNTYRFQKLLLFLLLSILLLGIGVVSLLFGKTLTELLITIALIVTCFSFIIIFKSLKLSGGVKIWMQ